MQVITIQSVQYKYGIHIFIKTLNNSNILLKVRKSKFQAAAVF